MTGFVEECRREWKRLRVPGAIADAMADDLTADLREAEADGASVEEVLGSGASDPRAFAAAWARERGIARPRRSPRLPKPGLLAGILIALLLLVVLAVVGAGVALLASSGESSPVRNVATTVQPTLLPAALQMVVSPLAEAVPSGTSLLAGRKTNVLHERPAAILISFVNSGRVTIDKVTISVRIDGQPRYQHTFRNLVSLGNTSVRVELLKNLPRHFLIFAQALPPAGKRGQSSNQAVWRVTIRK